MTNERWNHIETLLEQAMGVPPEQRAAFLDQICEGDAALRAEVDSLLVAYAAATPFFEDLAEEVITPSLAAFGTRQQTQIPAGQTVGHYRILEKLGGGGMGVVYKARDLKLDRFVALKFLPPHRSADPNAKRRLAAEAKAASALDHPHIGVVHEIGETDDGAFFIAMAYYEGQTLKEKIAGGALPVEEAVTLTIQIAEGLARAHAQGIVHRDVKPANVMLTEEGLVKIVDFGLAKVAGLELTQEGMTMGTVSYMSPEQTQGEAVDARADVWALGVVLYEMLTGTRPFRGDHEQSVIYAIRHDVPKPVRTLRAEAPAALAQIVTKAMAKKASDRYRHMEAFLTDLKAVQQGTASEVRARLRSWMPRARSLRTGLVVALLAVAMVLVSQLGSLSSSGEPPLLRPTRSFQLTTATGVEGFPAWSPDGQTLAYAANPKASAWYLEAATGNWDIWIRRIGEGPPLNRTADHPGTDRMPSWSPDGRQIAFWSDREGGGVYVMPALAGPPRKVASVPYTQSAPQWSPDGRELAFGVPDSSGSLIYIASLADGTIRPLLTPNPRIWPHDLQWSPDGQTFAYVEAFDRSAQVTKIWLLSAATGERLALTEGQTEDWSPSWSSDGRTVYFVSNRGGSRDLWQQRIAPDGEAQGPPSPVTTGVGMRNAAVSPDGSKFAYSKGRRVANLYRAPIQPDRPITWDDAEQLTFDQAHIEFVDVSPDGAHLLLSSDRSGNPDLWRMPATGGQMQQITTDPTPDWSPRWSPDGTQILFYAYRSGNRDLWVMPAGGGPARQLTHHAQTDWNPAWSPDGRHIAFASFRTGNEEVWVMPAEGGAARQMTNDPRADSFPEWTQDGQRLFYSTRDTLFSIPMKEGRSTPFTPGPTEYFRLSPDRQQLYFIARRDGIFTVWVMPVQGGPERRITNLTDRLGTLGPFALATDGSYLYFTWEEEAGDLWVMEEEDL